MGQCYFYAIDRGRIPNSRYYRSAVSRLGLDRKGKLFISWVSPVPLRKGEGRMGKYRQLNFADRIYLEALHWEYGRFHEKIAWRLGVHRSTIYRELRRGSTGRMHLGYRADFGERRRRTLAKRKGRPCKIVGSLEKLVREKLQEGWSPEQISGRLRMEGQPSVSHESIYRYIQRDRNFGGRLYLSLRHGHRRRKRRFHVPRIRAELLHRKSIDQRPKVITERRRLGDWERDLMFGSSRSQALLTLVERKSCFLILRKVRSKSPHEIAGKTIEALGELCALGKCKSLTNDNGFEFREHQRESQQLGIPIYFTHPYSSWERGTNENANGLVRQHFPKQSPIEEMTDEKTKMVQARLNARPRKKLGFLTPQEVLERQRFALFL